MKLTKKIKILYAMIVLIDDIDRADLLASAILRYIAGWGSIEFGDSLLTDSFNEIKEFLGDFE